MVSNIVDVHDLQTREAHELRILWNKTKIICDYTIEKYKINMGYLNEYFMVITIEFYRYRLQSFQRALFCLRTLGIY